MRQPSIIFLLISLIIISTSLPVYSTIKGSVSSSIPIDYSKLSEVELEGIAKDYYFNAQQLQNGIINEDMTNALVVYSILQNLNPENLSYCIKIGTLYDKLGMDKYARGNFSKAIGIDSSNPEPYFYYGEFYYTRQMYRKALKYYSEAYKRGYQTCYEMLYRMGDIYEKFGDTRSAFKYLQEAAKQNPNSELDNKIKRIEASHSVNQEYYSDTRLRG